MRPSPHQHHSVVNRNARLRELRGRDAIVAPPPPTRYSGPEYNPHDLDGRMKVVAERNVKIVVPHDFSEGKFSYEDAPNPLNQMGPVHEGCVPLVTSNDYQSFLAAFNKRSNFVQDGPDDDISDEAFLEAMTIIQDIPDKFDLWDDNDIDREQWLSGFAPAKKGRMQAAWNEICLAETRDIGRKDLSVKQEVLIKRDDPTWAPRVIYAGNDVFNAVTGPASNVVMKRAVELTRTHHVPIGDALIEFAYKTTDVKLCEFLFADEDLKETIEGDFSRNDREQRSKVALLYDAWLEKLGMPQWFRSLLLKLEEFEVVNKRFGFRAQLKYQLPTGTTSTTPRNSLYNAVMFAVALRRQRRTARAVILGDDLLACISERFDLDEWIKSVAEFKMVLKAKGVAIDGQATFLSRRIFAEIAVPCMVPLLGKMLVRFNIRSAQNDAITDSQYMAGKALSYAYECRHVPMLSEMFMRRFDMERDNRLVQTQDLTWFARTSNLSVADLIKAIRTEKVKVDDWSFGMWTCKQYGLDLEEVRELFERTVCDATISVIDLPNLQLMNCDIG